MIYEISYRILKRLTGALLTVATALQAKVNEEEAMRKEWAKHDN